MALPLLLVGATVAGAGLSIYGQIRAAQAQEEAARRDAELKEMQATELLDRQAINERAMLEASEDAQSNFMSAFASSGAEGGIGGVVQIHRRTLDAISNSRREAQFKAKMLRMGAQIEMSLASDKATAGYITGAGTALGTIGSLAGAFKGPGDAKSLPGVSQSALPYGSGDTMPYSSTRYRNTT